MRLSKERGSQQDHRQAVLNQQVDARPHGLRCGRVESARSCRHPRRVARVRGDPGCLASTRRSLQNHRVLLHNAEVNSSRQSVIGNPTDADSLGQPPVIKPGIPIRAWIRSCCIRVAVTACVESNRCAFISKCWVGHHQVIPIGCHGFAAVSLHDHRVDEVHAIDAGQRNRDTAPSRIR